jgi:predicted  nucleic acid-binding Zn-ribbon protein
MAPGRPVGTLEDGTPFFSPLGEVAYDADVDLVQCHLCGRWLRTIGGSHLVRTHGWSIERYRAAFKLPKRIATAAKGTSETRRLLLAARIAEGDGMASSTGRFATDRAAARAAAATAADHRIIGVRRSAATIPALGASWDAARNAGVELAAFGVSSRRRVWWRCLRCGNGWQASIATRAGGTGCPRCAVAENRRKLKEASRRRAAAAAVRRPLAQERPDLVAELDRDRNGELDPASLSIAAGRVLWWCCARCGHRWRARVSNRAGGSGCPACAGRHTLPERSLAALHPELALEWHRERNGELDPSRVAPASGRRVWWRCPTCTHEWEARIDARTLGRTGCPACALQRRRHDLTGLTA